MNSKRFTIEELRRQAELLLQQASAIEASECTGIAASWCPVCGECVCPYPEDSMDDPDCPLHNYASIHAETFGVP